MCSKSSSLRRLRQRSIAKRCSTKAGPIDHHVAPFAASSVKTTGSMEAELAMKCSCRPGFFTAARVLGNLSRLRALQRRDSEKTGKDTCLQSKEEGARRHCKENVLSKRAQAFTKSTKTFGATGSCTTT